MGGSPGPQQMNARGSRFYENHGVTTEPAQSQGYGERSVAWSIEYVDPREPEAGTQQVGAFTTEHEAQRVAWSLGGRGILRGVVHHPHRHPPEGRGLGAGTLRQRPQLGRVVRLACGRWAHAGPEGNIPNTVQPVVGPARFNLPMDKVVVGALVSGSEVLLVHRRPDKRARPGFWDLPGGVIEADESELDALRRELHEELDVDITTASVTYLAGVEAGSADQPASLRAWLVREWQGTPRNAAPEEHDDIGWFDLEALPPPPNVVVRTALVNAMREQQS